MIPAGHNGPLRPRAWISTIGLLLVGAAAGSLLTAVWPSDSCERVQTSAFQLERIPVNQQGRTSTGGRPVRATPATAESPTASAVPAAGTAAQSQPTPFYLSPSASRFRFTAEGITPVTDKVTTHAYDAMYSHFFEQLHNKRMEPLKVLEIGLGCDMDYGPGASAQLWRKYMPNAEVWFAEYDGKCVKAHQTTLDRLHIRVVVGDQAQPAILRQWVQQSGGKFDVIIDDGGHKNHQIYNSFQVLFHEALKPGGAYVIEDLQVSRHPLWRGSGPVMADVVRDWIDSLMRASQTGNFAKVSELRTTRRMNTTTTERPHRHPLPPTAKSIHCFAEACVVVKCTQDDFRCPNGGGFSKTSTDR